MIFAPSALSRSSLQHPSHPTLYSLFETQENIKLLSLKNSVSYQRYLSAWDFSAQLCSIEHPGRAPCFFPSDFSAASGRRSVLTITTLVENCSSLVFYDDYHRRISEVVQTKGSSEASEGIELDEILREYERTLDENEQTIVESEKRNSRNDNLFNCNTISSSKSKPKFRPSEGFGPSYDPRKPRWAKFSLIAETKRPVERLTNEGNNHPNSYTDESSLIDFDNGKYNADSQKIAAGNPKPKVLNPNEEQTPGVFPVVAEKMLMPSGKVPSEKLAVEAEIARKFDSLKSRTECHPKEKVRSAFYRSLDSLKRAFARKCLSGSDHIRLSGSQWDNAEDSFIARLAREFRDLETLIQEFLEIL